MLKTSRNKSAVKIDIQKLAEDVIKDQNSDLAPKSVIVLDNASFHKNKDMQIQILKAGYTFEHLPPYNPDFNPIEHKWAEINFIRKKIKCNVDSLFRHCSI